MKLINSYLSVWDFEKSSHQTEKAVIKSVSKKIRKVPMGITNIFFSFSSNGSKEIVERVCNLNRFCIAVSLETRILEIFIGLLFILKIYLIPFQVFLMLSELVLR